MMPFRRIPWSITGKKGETLMSGVLVYASTGENENEFSFRLKEEVDFVMQAFESSFPDIDWSKPVVINTIIQ